MPDRAKPFYVLNGPNLNLLGEREPEIYGRATLADVKAACEAAAPGRLFEFRQTNREGELIDWLHEARTKASVIILNPGAYAHTSIALRDAVGAIKTPVIEVHLSNTAARESFRHRSHVSPVAKGVIMGFGADSYVLAVAAALRLEAAALESAAS